jgi:hypothetical protein
MSRPEMPRPETSEAEVPKLVARLLKPVAQIPLEPQPKPVPPVARSGAETKAAMDRVNNDRTIENQVMNQRGPRHAPQPSEKNNQSQAGGFAGIKADLTFSRISTSSFAGSNYMKSRRVG